LIRLFLFCVQAAAERAMEFHMAIFADPVYKGDWPASVKERVTNLPHFSTEQSAALKGTFDYFPLNFYTSQCVPDCLLREMMRRG
jgi:beta-glucosidase/6-phospho-beta-glucosidase/beta-galactosidase